MEIPCIKVPRVKGEAVRSELAARDAIDDRYQIEAEEDSLFIPVNEDALDGLDYQIVRRNHAPRDTQTLPRDLLADQPNYERLGELALLDEADSDQAMRIAEALLEADLPISTVLNKRSKVQGETRVRDWELLIGDSTETIHREYGASFLVDITESYFSPRLATERHRVIDQITPGEQLFDMFAGVGPYVIQAARRGAVGVGVDINQSAIRYLRENAKRNGVSERVTAIHGDVRDIVHSYNGWADRVIMNLPHRADEFLEAARILAADRCWLHYYDIQPDSAPFSAGKTAIRNAFGKEWSIAFAHEQEVRSYAPHEINVCLDVELRRNDQ